MKLNAKRFKLTCRMLRKFGKLDIVLPGQREKESPIDWLVRIGLAPDAWRAAEMLAVANDITGLLDELEAMDIEI